MKVLCTAQMGTGNVFGQTMRAVAVAKALLGRGHEVKFIAAGTLLPVIKNFGFDVWEAARMPSAPPDEIIPRLPAMLQEIRQIEREAALTERPHLIISGTLTGTAVARELGIPSIMTFLQPHGDKTLQAFKTLAQRYDDGLVMKTLLAMLVDAFEAANLIVLEGMPEISGGIAFETFGDALVKSKEKFRFAGPLLVEYPDQLPEREALKQAHTGEAQQKMAYITIGGSAMIGERFLETVLNALRLLPEVTGVIAAGVEFSPEAINQFEPPANASIRGFVPGTELIKASDVTIFHGGSSTLMTCIACGTPAVVVPSMGEQEDNGAVLAQFGAGIVLDKKTLTPSRLVEVIQKVLHDNAYRQNAQQLKTIGEKYGGASAVADWAEALMKAEAI